MTKVPVFRTVRAALDFLFDRFGFVFRIAWFPMLVGAGAEIAAGLTDLQAIVGAGRLFVGGPAPLTVWRVAGDTVTALCIAMVAVACHRAILFGDLRRGTRLLFMILPMASYVLVWTDKAIRGPGVSAGFIGDVSRWPTLWTLPIAVALAAVFWISTRISVLYPAIVVTNRFALGTAWRLTKGNFWRLTGVYVLGGLALGIAIVLELVIGGVLASLFVAPLIAKAGHTLLGIARLTIVFGVLVVYVLMIPAVAFTVALVCHSYKALIGLGPYEMLPLASATRAALPPDGPAPIDEGQGEPRPE